MIILFLSISRGNIFPLLNLIYFSRKGKLIVMIYIFLLKFLKKVLTSKNKDVILIFVVAKSDND